LAARSIEDYSGSIASGAIGRRTSNPGRKSSAFGTKTTPGKPPRRLFAFSRQTHGDPSALTMRAEVSLVRELQLAERAVADVAVGDAHQVECGPANGERQ